MNYHWDIYRAFTTENYAYYWTLSNLKFMKEKLHLVQLNRTDVGPQDLNVPKLLILSSLLNWASGGHKNSE